MRNLIILLCTVFFANEMFAQDPVANFSVNQTTVCAGFPITFTDLSNYGGAAVVSTNWDFGQGGQSTDANPSYTYVNAGVYQVLLTVISAGGTDFELKLGYITVNPNPTALFAITGDGCSVPLGVTFNNLSTSGAGINYAWDFGNGQNSNLQNPPVIIYNANGNYDVQLIVTNTNTGCITAVDQTLAVSDFTAGITAPLTGCAGDPIPLIDASTAGANVWNWTSGDGQISTDQNPSFTYAAPGTYTITLTAQNTFSGCTDNASQLITINPLPTPSFTANPTSGCAPLQVTFTNTSGAGNFLWNFGNGQTSPLANPPVKTYLTDGLFTVSLIMTSPEGCVSTITNTDMISVGPPVANFNSNVSNGCAPLSVTFSDLSTSINPVDDPIISWLWTFGDGTTFNGQNPPAVVYEIGTYDVSLTITTQQGCVETATFLDTIQVGMIDLVDFSLFPIIECAKQDISFTDLSVISTPHLPEEVTYDWTFGDGGASTEQHPIYNYPIDTGFFDIQLIVNFRGCADTLARTDQVYIKAPISLFSVQTLFCNPAAFPVHVVVTDNAIAGATTDNVDMTWSWGVVGDPDDFLTAPDVFDANQGDTAHDYLTYGTYEIKQLINNYTTGCTDSTIQTIIISRIDAGFTLSNDTVCTNSQITLTSTSTFSDPAATFLYDLGDGNTINGDPVVYNYLTSGPHTISLTATNAAGCSDSIDESITVLDLPMAIISSSDAAGCLPINPVYSNFSLPQGNGVALSSFLWTFPDLTTQVTNNVATTTNFIYTTEGSFTTTLVATDVFGCVSPPATATMLITNPTVSFTMDPVVCDLENFIATNTSTGFGNLSYTWNVDHAFNTNSMDLLNFFDEVDNPLATNVPHTVSLIVTDENGCIDSLSQIVRVSMPIANLSYVASGATANAQGEYTCPPVFEAYTDLTSTFGNISSWSWDFGDGKTSAFQSPNNTYVFPGTYTLSLSIIDEFGCTSDTTLVDYLTILGPTGDMDWTSVGDLCEHLYEFTTSNLAFVDSIVWDMDDGNLVFDSTSFTYQFAEGAYNPTATLIDILGCEVTYDMPALVVNNITISADAGTDQAFCGDNTIMAGVSDPNGSGLWTLLTGAGIPTDPSLATTAVTGIGIGVNTFEWRIYNNCDTIRDTMTITITGPSTPSDAGPDQIICATTATMDGNYAFTGVGTWSLFSGSGTISVSSDSLTTITDLGLGENQFVWSIANVCDVASDIVSIIVEDVPTIPLAGPDQNACIPNSIMAANAVLVGTGVWTLFSGAGVITDPSSPTTTVSGLPIGPNVFVWTISNSCGSNSDTIVITGVDAPTTSAAGPDQFICITDANLSGNQPFNGVGTWSIVSGTGVIASDLNFGTTVSGLSVGPNVFEWSIVSPCGISVDQVTITVETIPTVSLAGIDAIACVNTVDLTANMPLIGAGIWTVTAGSATIATPNSTNTLATGLSLGLNTFLWTISNSCATTSDPVNITLFNMPTIPEAGLNLAICEDPYTLSANIPVEGVGSWSLISGTGIFEDPTNPNSTVSGLSVGPNIFHWTITNACGAPFDPVTITLEVQPTPAVAGVDQLLCGNLSQLDGNPDLIGTGIWTLISGSGSILDVNDSISSVSNLGLGENVFEWTISNSCATSSDQMMITITGECPDEDSIANILYFFVPNAFTPNEDDFNQMFLPIFTGGYDPQQFSLFIYDRWGELIFESHDASRGWLGRYGVDGVLVQDGTYTWKIKFTDTETQSEHTLVGHVNVLK